MCWPHFSCLASLLYFDGVLDAGQIVPVLLNVVQAVDLDKLDVFYC